MARQALVLALFAAAAVADATSLKVTPIEKVVSLLKGLQAKVAAEGKKEAAAYDKYACFCKEQADGKLYNIEKSTDKIGKLSEQIKSLDADVSGLNGDISKLSLKISGLQKTIDADADERAKDHAKYLVKAQDLSEAIGACTAGIAAMKDSKGGLSDAKVNLVQVHSRLLATASRQKVSSSAMELIQQLERMQQAPAKFTFQGNDIIALLEDLLADFKESKANMDQDEFDVKSVFEKKALGDSNEKKFAQDEKDESSALAEEKSEALNDAREARDEETNDRTADQTFLDTLTAECENKAKLFDQRSSTRSDELSAMTQAIEHLKGATANEGANKKLVGFVQGSVSTPPSFVQIRSARSATIRTLQQDSNRAVRRVLELLQESASRLDSKVLAGAAARVKLSADHFVKVRGLIKDLIAKLKADAEAEAEQKGFCDKAMSKAIGDRDEGKSREEAANAKLTTLTSLKDDLNNEIAELAEGIAANKKTLNEATELRNDEKAQNKDTVDDAEDGSRATGLALSVLSDFYKTAFLQTSKYTPPKADREGNTVGDLAPDTFDSEYKGAQGESKGIMGILEVIQSDFDRTIKTVKAEEKAAQDAFDKLEKENNDDTGRKEDTTDKKQAKLKQTEADILNQEQALKDATDLFNAGVEKLEDLKAMCVEGEETNEERKAARKKEIEALKDAQQVLDEWQA